MIPTPDEVQAALDAFTTRDMPALPGRTNHNRTGVLVPLIWDEGVTCIATVRASTLREHAGEVCFPGGRPDAADNNLEQTALREAHEELGMSGARVLGALSSIPLYTSDYRLVPYVAEVPPMPLAINEAEVAKVLRIAVDEVLSQPYVEAIPWVHEGATSLSPVFELDGAVMFGATAHTFYELLIVVAPLFDVALPPLKPGRFTWTDVIPSFRAP
jgi:8-oxo-dGTP pyrophosphatase MutT (NUDIX family)